MLGSILIRLLVLILPGYANLNDLSVTLMVRAEPLLALAVVLLVPLAMIGAALGLLKACI